MIFAKAALSGSLLLRKCSSYQPRLWRKTVRSLPSRGAGAGNVIADRRFQRRYVEEAMASADGNVSAAARKAGMTRAALHRILKRLGLASDYGNAEEIEEP